MEPEAYFQLFSEKDQALLTKCPDEVRRFLRRRLVEEKGIYRIDNDPRKPTAELVRAGDYSSCDIRVNMARFDSAEERGVASTTDLVLVDMKRKARTEEILARFRRRHLRPATFRELLAFGADYPEVQRGVDVIELGSAWSDDEIEFVASLFEERGYYHTLGRVSKEGQTYDNGPLWTEHSRFLAAIEEALIS